MKRGICRLSLFSFCVFYCCRNFQFLSRKFVPFFFSKSTKFWQKEILEMLTILFFKLPMSFPPWIIIHLFLMRTWTGWNFWPQCFTDPLSILSLHQPSLTSTVKEKNENYCSDLKLISELLLVHIIGWKKDCSAVKW